MGMAESFRSMFEQQGQFVTFSDSAGAFEPVEVSCSKKDFGYGAEPKEVNPRFRKTGARWFKFMVVVEDLPCEPGSGDTLIYGGQELRVRQWAPVEMNGEALLYKMFANTDTRRS